MADKRAEKERRLGEIEAREAGEAGGMVIEGYAAVFDSETLIGDEERGFRETIAPGAFEGADMKDVCLRYNHSDGYAILARTRNGSLTLEPDEKGLRIRAELLDTTDARDMYKRVKAGLIDKMSFAFTVADEDVEKGNPPRRTIRRFKRIFDVSVVDFPAYEETSIYARSLEHIEEEARALSAEEEKPAGISPEIKALLIMARAGRNKA